MPLFNVAELAVSGVNLEQAGWGIGVMNIQANISSALPEEHVVAIVMGEGRVESAVMPEDMLIPVEPVSVIVLSDVEARRTASLDANIVGVIEADTIVQADGLSQDNDWVRVLVERNAAWIRRDSVDESADLSMLPVMGPENLTPMQAFYFDAGLDTLPCNEAPPLLFLQGPDGIEVDVYINGVPVRIGSTVVVQIVQPGNLIRLTALTGLVILNPGMPDEVILPPGFTTTANLSEYASLGVDGQANDREILETYSWSAPQPLTSGLLAEIAALNLVPENILNYPLSLPSIIQPSGVGQTVPQFIFAPGALDAAQAACDDGRLSESICALLFPAAQ